ncbi:MAG: S9 family peptidase [Candidatus Azobacteroides sp.]|nr:S9 family peptidase [Candidatus Azobacteroides sp.]
MKHWISLFIVASIAMNGFAQEKSLTLEDLLPGGKTYTHFIPKTEYQIQWWGDELIFSDENALYLVNPLKPTEKKVVLTKDELNRLFNKENLKLDQISFVSFPANHPTSLAGKKKNAENSELAMIAFPEENRNVFFDLKSQTIAFELPSNKDWKNTDLCPENRQTAFTTDNNLYIADAEGQTTSVAQDSNKYIVYGQAVHRNEFGIRKGTFWSPQGNYLAFYRMDETKVGDYPLVDIFAREAQLMSAKYPMAGMTSHEVMVGIYNLQTKAIVYLKTGEPKDRYFTNISWAPDEKSIYIAELNREQNRMQWNVYDINTGEKTGTLLEETNDKYVEPQYPLLFLKKTPDRFILQSRKSGYNHLYLYDTTGKLIRPLTSGNYEVTNVLGLDEDEKHIFIVTNELNPIEFQAYKVNLSTGKKTQLTFEAGVHNPVLSRSGKYLSDRYSNLHTPLNIDLIVTTNQLFQPIRLQTAPNPFAEFVLPDVSIGTLKAADGTTDLYYRLVKPTNFDPTKKYPVVIYVYGGPHSQGIRNNWLGSTRGWEIYMAQKGYIIFSLDNRGTDNRGFEFESIIHRQLGIVETEDQMQGVEFLRSLPYVDAERIGVHGWSYGGFMTANLMLRHPETFKVGVAGGPVIDWKYYEIMYGERYMDSPQENPEGYEKTDMNRLAGHLQGRFLLIHGDQDQTVVWQNSLSFLKACIDARTYPDYFVYPGQEHNMVGADRIHLHEKITRYFEDFLK